MKQVGFCTSTLDSSQVRMHFNTDILLMLYNSFNITAHIKNNLITKYILIDGTLLNVPSSFTG